MRTILYHKSLLLLQLFLIYILTKGTSFLQGYTISFELVNEISQKIQILVEYTEVISKTADKEFGKVHEALIDIGKTLSQCEERISTLENVSHTRIRTYTP